MKMLLEELEEDVLIVDHRGVIKFASKTLIDKLGYTQAEVLQMNVEQILQVDWEKWQVKTYGENGVSLVTKVGSRLTYKVQVFKDDWYGESMWYVVGEERPLGEISEDEARSILEQLPMMIASKDLEGRYTYINKAGSDYCEYSLEELVGKTEVEIYGVHAGGIFQSKDKQIIEEKISHYAESWFKTKTGKMRLCNNYKSPLYDKQGQVSGLIKFAKQIMVSKWVELEQARQFNQDFKLIETGKKDDEWQTVEFEQQIIASMLKEVKAEGLAVWAYDSAKEKLVCKFAAKFNRNIVKEGSGVDLLGYGMVYKHKGGHYRQIKAMDDVDFGSLENIGLRDKLRAAGIQFMGVFDITYGGEFLGVVNLWYKEYEPADKEIMRGAERICIKLAECIKRVRVSEELEKTLQKRMRIEAELNDLLSTVSDGLWVSDEGHNILKVSRGICEMVGVSEEVLLDKGLIHYVYKEDRNFVMYIRRRCKEHPGEINRFVVRLKNVSGEWVWIECGGKYIVDKQIYVWTGGNVTQKYQFKKQQNLYAQQKQLQILKEEFLSKISQELREPLDGLLIDQQKLTQRLKVHNGEKYSYYIKKNIYRLMRLVNNLVDSTHIIAGEYQLKKENCEIVGVVEDISKAAARYAVYKGIKLYFKADIRERIIACDVDRIERVTLNLISNAIKYTPRGGEITIKLSKRADQVVLEVEDNGIGIPKEQLENIFEQFMQVDGSLTRQNEGSGMGLSLAKLLVELHDGKIYAQSILGKGSRITVELPDKRGEESVVEARRGRLVKDRMERCGIEFADIYDLD